MFSCFWHLCISKLYWNQLWVVSTVHLVYWALFLWRYLSCFVTVAINPAYVFAETWFPSISGKFWHRWSSCSHLPAWLHLPSDFTFMLRTRSDRLLLIISVFRCPLLNNDNIAAALRCSLLSCSPELRAHVMETGLRKHPPSLTSTRLPSQISQFPSGRAQA